jgi:hypothetical protein
LAAISLRCQPAAFVRPFPPENYIVVQLLDHNCELRQGAQDSRNVPNARKIIVKIGIRVISAAADFAQDVMWEA